MRNGSSAPVVVVTGDAQPNTALTSVLNELGARTLALPTITIAPPVGTESLDAAIGQLSEVDWIVCTSAHAAEAVCAHAGWQTIWPSLDRRPRVAAVGPATAACLTRHGMTVDLVPARASARDLAQDLAAVHGSLERARILWPRSDIARRDLPDALSRAGAVVIDPIAYRTLPVRPGDLRVFLRQLDAGLLDAVAFLSPSSATSLAAAMPGATLGRLAGRTLVASIGPSTSAALLSLGARADVESMEHTAAALGRAIIECLARRAEPVR